MAKTTVRKRRTMTQEVIHRLMKNKGAVLGAVFLILLTIAAIISPFIFDYNTDVIGQNLAIKLRPPGAEHWFGTDEYGRDLFARVVYGSRYSLAIALAPSAWALLQAPFWDL